jgi:putative flippase GtrA
MTRFLRFAIVGAVNTSVDFGIYAALTLLLNSNPLLANAISYSSGVVTSFIGNRDFTFRDREDQTESMWRRFAVFYGANLAGLLLASISIFVFHIWFGPVLAKALSIPLTTIFNYVMARRILSRTTAAKILPRKSIG